MSYRVYSFELLCLLISILYKRLIDNMKKQKNKIILILSLFKK